MWLCPVLANSIWLTAAARSWSSDAGPDPQHKVTQAHQRTWGDPNKTNQTNKKDTPDHTHTHAHTLTFNILTQRGPQATTGGSRGKGTTHGYDTWPESSRLHLAGAAVSVILSPPWRHLSETTGPKWDYCLRTGGSEAPPCTQPPPLSLLVVLEVRGRVGAQAAFSPLPPPRPSWLSLAS